MARPHGDGVRLTVRAYAKINLSLHVGAVRADGYHPLKTVFQSLALHDLLAFDSCEGPFSLACGAAGVPSDQRNLVWKAASLLWECSGRSGDARGVRARITKRIPAQGGLGGGSADAAAALVALDAIWNTALGPDRLQALARRLGADVPFFLCGGTALGLDRGDQIYPLEDVAPHTVVLVLPPFGVSTSEAYGWFDQDARGVCSEGPSQAWGEAPASPAPGVLRLAGGVGLPIVNELQAPVVRRHPDIAQLCARLSDLGAEVAAMTGSGSTVFGLFARHERGVAAAAALQAVGRRTLVTRSATRREARPRPSSPPRRSTR